LKAEKKCNNRGKRLNVLSEEHNKPILFSPDKVRHAQAVQAEKEENKRKEIASIDANRAATALKNAKDGSREGIEGFIGGNKGVK
jgi:hypothetical protein